MGGGGGAGGRGWGGGRGVEGSGCACSLANNSVAYEENQTKSPIFVIVCALCFQRHPF